MSSDNQLRVLIVGAGIAGPTLAYWLLRAGHQPTRALEDDGARVRVTFERQGTTRDFDLVVGADGLHSRVRRLVFGADDPFEKYLGLKIAAFELKGYRPREELVAKRYAEVGFQVTSFPMRGDATMFALTFRDEPREIPATRAKQEARLRPRFANGGWETPVILEEMSGAESIYLDRVSQIRMPAWTRRRVALLGTPRPAPRSWRAKVRRWRWCRPTSSPQRTFGLRTTSTPLPTTSGCSAAFSAPSKRPPSDSRLPSPPKMAFNSSCATS